MKLPEQPLGDDGELLSPKLPNDITRLANDELGTLYGQFVAVCQYADAHLALSDIEHVEVDYEADVTTAKHGLTVDGDNRDERKFHLELTPAVRTGKQQAMERRARKVILDKLITGYERAINALSREMSRRGMEINNDR